MSCTLKERCLCLLIRGIRARKLEGLLRKDWEFKLLCCMAIKTNTKEPLSWINLREIRRFLLLLILLPGALMWKTLKLLLIFSVLSLLRHIFTGLEGLEGLVLLVRLFHFWPRTTLNLQLLWWKSLRTQGTLFLSRCRNLHAWMTFSKERDCLQKWGFLLPRGS